MRTSNNKSGMCHGVVDCIREYHFSLTCRRPLTYYRGRYDTSQICELLTKLWIWFCARLFLSKESCLLNCAFLCHQNDLHLYVLGCAHWFMNALCYSFYVVHCLLLRENDLHRDSIFTRINMFSVHSTDPNLESKTGLSKEILLELEQKRTSHAFCEVVPTELAPNGRLKCVGVQYSIEF